MTKETNDPLKIRDDGLYYTKGAKKPFTGLQKIYHDNGKLSVEAPFKKGKQEGIEKQWYDSGKKLLEMYYKNNKAEGLCTHYYNNGHKEAEGMYQDDEKEGLWSYYDENGKKNSYDIYKRGELFERDGSKISSFSRLIVSYEQTYNLKLQNYYEAFQPDKYSYDQADKTCNYPTNTIIVDTGDVSYLVLRPNKDPIRLDPFFDVSEDSVDSSYKSNPVMSTIVHVDGEGFLPMVRFFPGVDDFDYPSIENPLPFNSAYKKAYESFETMFTTNQSAFKDLDLDAEKNYILGRKLVISVIKVSDAMAPIDSFEGDLPDEIQGMFVKWVAEKITEIYEWAAYDEDEDEDS